MKRLALSREATNHARNFYGPNGVAVVEFLSCVSTNSVLALYHYRDRIHPDRDAILDKIGKYNRVQHMNRAVDDLMSRMLEIRPSLKASLPNVDMDDVDELMVALIEETVVADVP